MGTGEFNAGGNPAMDWHRIQGGVEILLVASCYRTWDKLRPGGPQLSHMQTNLTFITSEEFKNIGFTLKTHQALSVHNTSEEFKNATITGHFGFMFEENSAEILHDYRDAIDCEKCRFQNVFRPRENSKPKSSIPQV